VPSKEHDSTTSNPLHQPKALKLLTAKFFTQYDRLSLQQLCFLLSVAITRESVWVLAAVKLAHDT